MEINENILSVYEELNWLEQVIHQSIASYLLHEGHEQRWYDIPLPVHGNSAYGSFINKWELDQFERLALILAFAPTVKPEILDVFFGKNEIYDRNFTEFGGIVDREHSGFLPTLQTLFFLITSVNPDLVNAYVQTIGKDSVLVKEQILRISNTENNVPSTCAVLGIENRWSHYFLTGEELPIEQSSMFPAHKITTGLNWEDVVLDETVLQQVVEICTWIDYGDTLMNDWGLLKNIKPGYRSLFYGPPGTGKTLTATLLGKATNREVYRVDLSMVISKYIGETEKNLAKIFDIAQYKNWILFFDEADALFGKRTVTNSSNDRHANQQTGYLLQRIEDFPGIIILASNLKENMDAAFTRRFQSMINFKMPSVSERLQLWQNAFSGKCCLHPSIDVYKLAEEYELSGGAIINVLRYCALSAIKRKDNVVTRDELINGLRREFMKDHKTIVDHL